MSTIRLFLDAAGSVPVSIWIGIGGIGVMVTITYWAVTAPLTTPEQRERIAAAHREIRGTRGMPSTRSTAPATRSGARPRRPVRGEAATTAQVRGRPRRAR